MELSAILNIDEETFKSVKLLNGAYSDGIKVQTNDQTYRIIHKALLFNSLAKSTPMHTLMTSQLVFGIR